MTELHNILPLKKIDNQATYLLLISPDQIPHLAIVHQGNYYSLTHKKAIVHEPFKPYYSFLKRSGRKMLFLKLNGEQDNFEAIFSKHTRAAAQENTCLIPVKESLLPSSKAEFVYQLIPELQAEEMIVAIYHLNMENDLMANNGFIMTEYSKNAIFDYIDSLNEKHAKRS